MRYPVSAACIVAISGVLIAPSAWSDITIKNVDANTATDFEITFMNAIDPAALKTANFRNIGQGTDNTMVKMSGGSVASNATFVIRGLTLGLIAGHNAITSWEFTPDSGPTGVTAPPQVDVNGTYETLGQITAVAGHGIYATPVPELGQWTLMSIGIGAAGMVFRARRARARVAMPI
jgi:hypothetical protein